jgi:hypothetical protein
MKNLPRLFFVPQLLPCCLASLATHRMRWVGSAHSPMTGFGVWRSTYYAETAVPFVQLYGSLVAAFILWTRATKQTALSALMG